MNIKTFGLSCLLLIGLVIGSLLVNRDVVQSLTSNSDASVVTDSSQYLLGNTIVFTGTLSFAADESTEITEVKLSDSTGPQTISVVLPLGDTGGAFVELSSEVSGTLSVKVTHTDVELGSSTLPSTLPSTTKPRGSPGERRRSVVVFFASFAVSVISCSPRQHELRADAVNLVKIRVDESVVSFVGV